MNMEAKVAISPRIVENHAGQPCYLVEYDEDQWLKYDKEGQDYCFTTWAGKAKPLGAVFVVLRLIPDALFPSGEHTIPYIARSYPIEQDTFDPVTVTTKLTANIHADTYASASEMERCNLKLAARVKLGMHALGHGASYEIMVREGKEIRILERGRL